MKAKRKFLRYKVASKGTLWSEEEQIKFIAAVKVYGRDWLKVSQHVATRDKMQTRLAANTLKLRLEDDSTLPGAEILPILEDARPRWTKEEIQKL